MVPSFVQKGDIESHTNMWNLDNTTSNHIIGRHEKFSELNENGIEKVHFGDGSTVNIDGKCTIRFKCKNGDEHTLREVYYGPMMCNNIIT